MPLSHAMVGRAGVQAFIVSGPASAGANRFAGLWIIYQGVRGLSPLPKLARQNLLSTAVSSQSRVGRRPIRMRALGAGTIEHAVRAFLAGPVGSLPRHAPRDVVLRSTSQRPTVLDDQTRQRETRATGSGGSIRKASTTSHQEDADLVSLHQAAEGSAR